MKKWAVSFIVIIAVAAAAFIVINRFIVMPWENADLPKVADPKLVIKKKARTLELFDGPTLVKTYTVVLGSTPDGDKETEGDGRTPEGDFYIFTKNAESKFFLSLGVSYPGIADAERGLNEGLISQDEHDSIVRASKKRRCRRRILGSAARSTSTAAVLLQTGRKAVLHSEMKK